MEQQQASPPAYVSHNPADIHLPSAPRTDISHAHAVAEITLPDLKTILSPDYQDSSHSGYESPRSVRSLPRIDPGPGYVNGDRRSLDSTIKSPSENGSIMSIDDRGVRSTSVSMDDPDVRIAAEALSGLGNPDFVRSPTSRTLSHPSPNSDLSARLSNDEPEPLFQLFTKAHPWVGGTINTSLNAYSTTKNYSPRFVQYGASVVERSITMPVVSTVNTVGRMTGVESGLRWYYGGNATRPNDIEQGGQESVSTRMIASHEMDFGSPSIKEATRFRRDSQESGFESLPGYRSSKPPSYREEGSPAGTDRRHEGSTQPQSWPSQMFVMTSGLGAALSVTSRRSLRYCLSFLGRQAQHITTVTSALKLVLDQYDQARDAWHQNHDSSMEKGERPRTPDHDEAARRLAEIIRTHSEDIWRTLQNVVTSVSNYAGGALPENARHFVKGQLMSLPQRWRFVSDNQTGEGETSRGAHRMIAFATEGLDMMGQVSQTMKLTLDSAERWLERVGRQQEMTESPYAYEKDHDMMDTSSASQR